jgi:transglutaminase-like putative cysteine protease
MQITIDVSMTYTFPEANTVCLVLEVAATEGQEILEQNLQIGDATVTRIAGDAGVGQRMWAQIPGTEMRLDYHARVDVTRPAAGLAGLQSALLHDIPAEAAPYLRPSRYCQSDKFVSFVAKRFGHLPGGEKVDAIRDWIETELSYVPGSSDADTNVLETFAGRQGVCRDYAHLFCAMVRAAQIPARMVAAYAPDVVPPDFHALGQVWLGGAWHLVDATGMSPADTIAVVAVGRDAYDIAFMTSEAPATLVNQSVLVQRA